MRSEEINADVEIPEGVQVNISGKVINIKGAKGELSREFKDPNIEFSNVDGKIKIMTKKPSKKEKAIIFTYRAHVRNMIKGVTESFKYELKICSTHFPMNVAFNNGEITVKNFFGEKSPRVLKINSDVKVAVKDKIIELESCDKEKAGTAASNIEQLTRVTNKDRRIFQDGIFIINKAGKVLK